MTPRVAREGPPKAGAFRTPLRARGVRARSRTRRNLRVVAALALAGAIAVTTPASAEPRGVFVAHCTYSHSLPDDPIVHPGMPGGSHLHDFFGNTTTDAASTIRDMLAARTTCSLSSDTAGYWFPAASLGPTALVPTFAKVYYFGVARGRVEALPPGLRIVAGNPEASSPEDNPHVTWSCGAKGARRTPIIDHPYDCTRLSERWEFVDSVVARVELPSCWDGTGLEPSDLAYVEDRAGPDGFGHRLPGMRMQVHVGVLNPCAPRTTCRSGGTSENVILQLSSGPFFTLHADLWNTWHQHALERLVLRCLDAHRRCGTVSD